MLPPTSAVIETAATAMIARNRITDSLVSSIPKARDAHGWALRATGRYPRLRSFKRGADDVPVPWPSMTSDDAAVIIERHGPKLLIRLNRPAAMNAQNDEMRSLLVDA